MFDIAYNEDNMPPLLDGELGCKTLRDFSAWKLAGLNALRNACSCYAVVDRLNEWAESMAGLTGEPFGPYIFMAARQYNDMTEFFEEWEMEIFIKKMRGRP